MLLGFWVDGLHLQTAHMLVSLLGAFMALYVMQLWSRGEITPDINPVISQLRRASLMILALALLWSVSYANDKNWDPWPADFLTNVALDMILGATIIAVRLRRGTKATH